MGQPIQSTEDGMFVCEYAGAEGSAPLLYLHGLGVAGMCFDAPARHPRLEAHRQLIIDLPGYGRSLWQNKPPTLVETAGHIASWLGKRDEGPVILVGHSMGGVLAVYLAERHPQCVAGIINVEGNVSPGDCSSSAVAAGQPLDEFLENGFTTCMNDTYHRGLTNPASRILYSCMQFCDPQCFYQHSQELVLVSAEESMAVQMAALSCPAHFIAGQPGGSPQRSLDLLEAAGISRTKISPAGHWPFIDQPDAFAAAISNILSQFR